jgi:hypothetical protein
MEPRHDSPDASFKFGGLHDVVGKDGVLVISLLRKQVRFDHTAAKLKEAAIWPTLLPAADNQCLKPEELNQGCAQPGSDQACQEQGRTGTGCVSVYEQAIAESHRRALVAASERQSDWTAIFEDDVVPVRAERWSKSFKKAWKQVPDRVKMVRLSWCHFPAEYPWFNLTKETFHDAGDFHLVNWTGYTWPGPPVGGAYNPGLCTAAYMVHKEIIPEMLKLFPCCTAVDACYLLDFFVKGRDDAGGTARGMEVVMNLDAWGSTEYAKGFQMEGMAQSGVLVQDVRELPSSRGTSF